MLVIFFFNYFLPESLSQTIILQFPVYIPYSNLSVKLWLCPDMMSHLSIALFDWQGSWLYMKLTSYLCIIKHSFDSVFVMDSLCKNQLETVVFIEFSHCYNNLYFLREEKNVALLFRNITYTLKHTWKSLLNATHNFVPFFFLNSG